MESQTTTDPSTDYATWKMAFLASFSIFAILIGIIGNTFVLYTSVRCRDQLGGCRASLTFIKHLTISDILCLLFLGMPALSHYLCSGCGFSTLCVYTNYARPALTSANFKFIFLISIHRLFRCYKPHSAMTIQPLLVDISAIVVYVVCAGETTLTYMALKGANFTVSQHGCHVDISDQAPYFVVVARFIHIGIAMVIPFVGTIMANALLWAVACRATHTLDIKPVIAVSAMSGMILISWLPFIIYMFQKYIFNARFNYAEMEEIAFNLILVSVVGNPIIYTVFNKSFSDYLFSKLRRSVPRLQVAAYNNGASNSNISHLG